MHNQGGVSQGADPLQDADISTSSEDYASRFSGAVGRWFVETQTRTTLSLLSVVTRSDLEKHKKEFLLLSALYPALWSMAKLDGLLPAQAGYKLIARARRSSSF